MRRIFALLLIAGLLTACGGGEAPESGLSQDDIINTKVAATMQAAKPTDSPEEPATRTPDNEVETAEAGGLNNSFATAQELKGDPVRATVKESELFYKVDVPRGGVISATLAVEAGSPQPARLTLYDENQNWLAEEDIPVGERREIARVFGAEEGGTVFVTVKGNSSFLMAAVGGKQNDGGTGKDAPDELDKALGVKTGTISGILGDTDTRDIFSFELPKTGQVVKVTLKSTEQSQNITLYDEDQNWLNEVSSSDEDAVIPWVVQADKGGRWFIEVEGEGSYNVTLETSSQDDAGSEKDAGAEFEKGLVLKIDDKSPAVPGSVEIEGLLGNQDTEDYYGIDLPKNGGMISATLTTEEGDVTLTVYDDNENYVNEANTSANAADPAAVGEVLNAEDGGRWNIRVRGEGSYKLTVSWANQDDAKSGKDAGADFGEGIALSEAEFSGMVGGRDADDYYKVKGDAGGKLKVTHTGGEGTINVTIYDQDRNYVTEETIGSAGDSVDMAPQFSAAGDYFIRVRGDGASYTIAISQ